MPILGLGKSKEEKEIERSIQAKQGRKTIQRYVKKQKDMLPKLWGMAKEALRLEDDGQFKQVILQYWWTQQQITRWERYVLTYDMVEARRDQARSTREFLGSLQAMGQSMMANAEPKDMVQMQKDLQMGLARAEAMEERLNIIMETADDYVYDVEGMDEGVFDEIKQAMQKEAAGEAGALDEQIAGQLKDIEEQMRREMNS